ncbi:MAG: hypothetical protein KAY65_17105 [Planctomycetes bacterium]|nr:hypothetical protein [Planctomycetota bacterium]
MSVLRKLLIGVVSLAAVLGIYVLYSRTSKTPPIDVQSKIDLGDSNLAGFDGQAGKIGDIKIPVLKNPVYKHVNANKEIDREFGFSELIRTVGDVWEVEKPWMKIYQRRFECHIRADQGTIELETVVGDSTPKDATFSGNVVVRILAGEAGGREESVLYLDSLVFLSEKSQFSTAGPVKFVSAEAQMLGRGLEFVYNDRAERLEYLRLPHVESLHIKTSESALFSETEPNLVVQKGPQTGAPTKGVEAVGTAKAQVPASSGREAVERTEGQYYKCILSKNVVIDTPEQLVFAKEDVTIGDILWSKSSAEESDEAEADGADAPGTTAAAAKETELSPAAGEQAKAAASEPNEPPEKMIDIVITCDNGVLVVPVDSRKTIEDFSRSGAGPARTQGRPDKKLDAAENRATFRTGRIDYSAATGDANAVGPSELVFYTGDVMAVEANETSVPVTVTSTKGAKFFKAANQVIFEGEPLCAMPQHGLTAQRDVTLSASKLTVNLQEDISRRSDVSPEIVGAGPVEFIFYVEDSNAAVSKEPPVPVRVTAQKEARFLPDSNQVIFDVNCLCTMPREGMAPEQNFTLRSSQLIANLPKDRSKGLSEMPDILAVGPVELGFFVDAFGDPNAKAAPLPGTVTAKKQAHFLPSSNQVLFERDCKSRVVRKDPNFVEEHILMSERMTVDLPADSNQESSGLFGGIEHLSAYGGVVRLATKKTGGDLLLSGIELICRKFDYDPNQELYTAAGPGEIRLANAETPEPNQDSGKFSLSRPCWAIVQNYDTLKYFLRENRIIAEASSAGALVVKYLPIKDGKFSEVHIVTANRVVANLTETAAGDTELSTLTASGGVTYQGSDNEFIGGGLFYDHAEQLMKVVGSERFPCLFNGQLTDEIEYNLKTGEIKADLVAPGTIQLK